MNYSTVNAQLQNFLDQTTRRSILQNLSKTDSRELSVNQAAELLDVNRTSIYYQHQMKRIEENELEIKAIIDTLHTDNPTWGARQMKAQLNSRGYKIGRKKTRRYMTEMAIDPIYPKMNLSKRKHSAIGYETPAERYYPAMLLPYAA